MLTLKDLAIQHYMIHCLYSIHMIGSDNGDALLCWKWTIWLIQSVETYRPNVVDNTANISP